MSTADTMGYAETERVYGIKRGTLYSLVSKKIIPHIRVSKRLVLFSRTAIEKWLAAHEIKPIQR